MDVASTQTPEAVRAAPIAGGTIATPDDLNSTTISSVNQNNEEVIMPYNNAFDIENLKMNIESKLYSLNEKVQDIENHLSSQITPPHDYKQLYIESLLSRIESLERCTQYQQEIIRLMQKNSSPHIASPSDTPSDTQAEITPAATASLSENASTSAPGQNIIDKTSKKKPLPVKKKAIIIGDSMLGGVRNWQRDEYSVKVNPYGGATSEDMVSMTDIALRRDPAILIVHVGTNDLKNKVDTKKHLQRVIANARSSNANMNIGISAICHREDDKRLINKVKDMNNQLKNFCSHHQVVFIDHDDFDHTCLSKGKLHPNFNGNKSLYMDFDRTIKSMV